MAAFAPKADGQKALLFVPGTSWLYRLNPLTKLTALLWIAVAAFVLRPEAGAVVLALCILAALAAGIVLPFLRRLLLTMVPLAIGLGVVHGFLVDHGDGKALGPLSVSLAGLIYAAEVFVRIATLMAGSLLFVITTHPGQLLKALDAKGFSPALAYLVASPLMLLEPFGARARAIRDAQMARGLDLEGGRLTRIRALPALLVPMVTLTLADIDQRAQVLDGRGFRAAPRRTVLAPPSDARYERALRWLCLVSLPFLIAGGLLWR